MTKLRLNLNDLEEMCRAQGYFDLTGVEWAIMETNGQLSILPRTDKRPLQVGDVLEQPPREELARLLILDGQINERELKLAGRDRDWLRQRLAERQLRPEQVLVAGVDEQGRFFAQEKEGRR